MLGAVGVGAVWGWLVAMAWLAGPRRTSGATVALGVASLAPAGLSLVYAGVGGVLAFAAAAIGFAGLHAGWQRWLAGLTTRGRE